eukprot:2003729-Amphidinium_carterae.1
MARKKLLYLVKHPLDAAGTEGAHRARRIVEGAMKKVRCKDCLADLEAILTDLDACAADAQAAYIKELLGGKEREMK